MAKITITAPNAAYNGVSAGVRFTDGVAVIEDTQHAALEYFGRHRFGISKEVSTGDEAELTVPAAPAPVDLTDAKALGKLKREELDKLAEAKGIDTSGASNKDEVVALIVAGATAAAPAPATATEAQAGIVSENPPAGAGDGPAGALHNEGRDAANPDGIEPPVTPPADAGI